MQPWLCEDKLKRKTTHFQLLSVSQKCACLSSLIVDKSRETLRNQLPSCIFSNHLDMMSLDEFFSG